MFFFILWIPLMQYLEQKDDFEGQLSFISQCKQMKWNNVFSFAFDNGTFVGLCLSKLHFVLEFCDLEQTKKNIKFVVCLFFFAPDRILAFGVFFSSAAKPRDINQCGNQYHIWMTPPIFFCTYFDEAFHWEMCVSPKMAWIDLNIEAFSSLYSAGSQFNGNMKHASFNETALFLSHAHSSTRKKTFVGSFFFARFWAVCKCSHTRLEHVFHISNEEIANDLQKKRGDSSTSSKNSNNGNDFCWQWHWQTR